MRLGRCGDSVRQLISNFDAQIRANPTIGRVLASESTGHLIRFGISGLLSTAFYFALANLYVIAFGMKPVWASVIAYAIAIGFSYSMQSRYTFRVRQDSRDQVLRFVVTSVSGLAISYWVVWLFNDYLGARYWVGPAFVCIIIPVINFVIFKRWVFARSGN